MIYSIEKITTLIGARRVGTADAQIGWLLTDSRSLCFPEETLFFALKTARNDGHKYIEDLYRRGVRNFVVSSEWSMVNGQWSDANFLVVNGAVLCPTYAQPDLDRQALETIGRAFPGRDIVGIDCRTLIRQHGSLHCCTMQLPEGVLSINEL